MHPDSKVLPAGFERDLLELIADATGRCLGLGLIEHINFVGHIILLTTPVRRTMTRIAQFGDVYVARESGERGQVKWAW